MEHFDLPFVTGVSCPPGVTQLVGTDPRRIYLSMANPTSIPLVLDPEPNNPLFVVNCSLPLVNYLPAVVFRQASDGSLCQVQWCVNNPSALTVTVQVIQMLLKDWPGNG